MLPSSFRRALCSAAQSPAISSFSSSSPRAALSQTLTIRSHQRRLSSSKPSKPADGPKRIAKESVTSATSTKTPRTRSTKRKANSNAVSFKEAVVPEAPRVPDLHDLDYTDIALQSFFARHQPIALTKKISGPVTQEAFEALFDAKSAPQHTGSVVSALFDHPARVDAHQLSRKEEMGIQNNQDFLSLLGLSSAPADQRPFVAPPVPQPVKAGVQVLERFEIEEPPHPHSRTFTTMITIEESTDANGNISYETHNSPLIEEIEEPEGHSKAITIPEGRREKWECISVRRQRKLKMKKHKYKKLMQKTRNLRRRQDRN